MKFRGGIWLPEDGLEGEIHARLTINESGDEITIAGNDDFVLAEWQLAEVVVKPLGDSDFLLTRNGDELVFRPDGRTAYKAFANATTSPSRSARNLERAAAHASSGGRKAGRWKSKLGGQGKHRR